MANAFEHRHASILIVDIRNFTPNLKDSERSAATHKAFCHFLSQFYQTCVETCSSACDPSESQPLYINSTGDGILSVFLSRRRHFIDAYLAGIMLFNRLPVLFDAYNRNKKGLAPAVSFGIGADSGEVWRVTSADAPEGKPVIETYIGDCINIAARVESVTKEHDRTHMIISQRTYELLCRSLCDTDYNHLWRQATNSDLTGRKKKTVWDRMNKLDESFLLRFISAYNLRGVSEAIRLYRLSPTLASPKTKECQRIFNRLTVNAAHLRAVHNLIRTAR